MDADAVVQAVREVATGAKGYGRVVPVDRIEEGVFEGLPDSSAALRSLVRTAVDVRMPRTVRTGAVGPQTANREVLAVELDLRLTHAVMHEVDEDGRHEVRAAAAEDAVLIRRALGVPGQLTTTLAGAPTGIVSGLLLEREPGWEIVREDWTVRILASVVRLRGWVLDVIA